MAAPRTDFAYGTFDGATIVLMDDEGPVEVGPDVRDVFHPTARMVEQVDLIRAAAQHSMANGEGAPPVAFLALAFADAFLGARELLLRFIDGDPEAYRLAETYLAIGFGGVPPVPEDPAEPPIECLRLDVSLTLDEIEEATHPNTDR